MFSALTAGIVFGLSAGLAPGPLLTFVITQTLKYNIKEGVKAALAPLVTDLPIIAASLLVLGRLSDFKRLLGVIAAIGAVYVFYLAYESFTAIPVNPDVDEIRARSLSKAILVNALNPHPYLFWITVGGPLVLKFNAISWAGTTIFIGCFYCLLVGAKIALALVVGKSRVFLTGKGYVYVMRLLGVSLAVFALFLIRDAFVFWGA